VSAAVFEDKQSNRQREIAEAYIFDSGRSAQRTPGARLTFKVKLFRHRHLAGEPEIRPLVCQDAN
jgi:hypothetical protein